MSEDNKPNKRHWVNTRVEWSFVDGKFVETAVEGYWYDGPLSLLHPAANTDQEIYRWRDDDGTDETDGTWLEIADTTHDFDVSSGNVKARLRVSVAENGGADESSKTYPLEFQINGGGYTTLGAATTGCIYHDSTKLTNNSDTTEQLSGPGTFQSSNGGQCEDGTVDAFVLTANSDVEFEYTVEFVAADLNGSDSIDFRVANLDNETSLANATVTKSSSTNVTATVGALTIASTNATVQANVDTNVTATVGALTIGSTNTTIGISTNVTATAGALTVAGVDASVQALANKNITATAGAITLASSDATIQANVDLNVAATVGAITLAATDATITVSVGTEVTATVGAISIAATDVTVQANIDSNVVATVGALTLSAVDATVQANVNTNINATTGALTISAVDASVQANVNTNIAVSVGAITVTGINTTVQVGSDTSVIATAGAIIIAGIDTTVTITGSTFVPVPLFLRVNNDMAIKNQSLTVNFLVWDTAANDGKTGDAANFTLRLIKDGAAPVAVTNAVSEPDSTNMPGSYELVLTAAEMNANFITLHGISSTGNVVIFPLYLTTESGMIATLDADNASGDLGANVNKINNVSIVGDGSATPFNAA